MYFFSKDESVSNITYISQSICTKLLALERKIGRRTVFQASRRF